MDVAYHDGKDNGSHYNVAEEKTQRTAVGEGIGGPKEETCTDDTTDTGEGEGGYGGRVDGVQT